MKICDEPMPRPTLREYLAGLGLLAPCEALAAAVAPATATTVYLHLGAAMESADDVSATLRTDDDGVYIALRGELVLGRLTVLCLGRRAATEADLAEYLRLRPACQHVHALTGVVCGCEEKDHGPLLVHAFVRGAR